MKKLLLIGVLVLFLTGCGTEENSLVKSNYINKNSYDKVYSDLESISRNINYFPTKELEKQFYEMIEVISDNCNKFTKEELDNFHNLINNGYHFRYSGERYSDSERINDLNKIKECKTE